MPDVPILSEIPAQMTRAQFWALFSEVEHEQLEFKRGVVPGELQEAIAAMSMTDGGLVIVGVRDADRVLVGAPLSQNTLDRVVRAAHSAGVEVQVREIRAGGKRLTVVAVPEVRGRIVTTTDGRLLRRVGSDCQPLVGDAMARFVREREDRSAEESILPSVDLVDFDLKAVNAALGSEGRSAVRRPQIPRALIDLGLALPADPPRDVAVTVGAALLFARDPAKYAPGASVQAVRRIGVGPGPGPAADRSEFRGPILGALEGVLAFIASHTRQFQAVLGAHRETIPEYPVTVLREGVLNALAHRDYGLAGSTVDVTVWDDRIEIRSPGPLPGPITLENMREEHYSRNRRIMHVLKLMGLVEEYGEGVDRMIRDMEARLMEPPIFSASPASVTVTIRNRFLVDVEDQVWLALIGHYDLSSAERRMLVLARREDGVTRRRIRELLPNVAASSLIAGGVAKGLLVQVGQRGGARYVLSDEVVMRAGATGLEARSRKRQTLLDEILRRGSLSTAEGASLLGDEPLFVRTLLNDLVRAGLVVARGRTRGRRYLPA